MARQDTTAVGDGTAAAGEAAAGEAAAAAGDSLTVAAWTMVSRLTGVVRIAVIGAVLGPSFFGNTYQFTNSLPNLVYYGFLAGSLFSSLLVPALVRHIDAGDRRAAAHVAGGFLGMTLAALLVVAPLAVTFGPLVLRFAALGGGPHLAGAAQVHVARLLIIMFIPQIFCYGVVATAIAVMSSRQRFSLSAGAPAIENIGTIAVLGATAAVYGTGTSLGSVPLGEMLLLGLGSTGAVALHATAQWWGARRAGVVLLPRTWWREPEVQVVVRRALPALAQAGLVALQNLALLAGANRLPGGVVAFQIALMFYFLADAIGTAPVAISLLPRLARMHLDGDVTAFRDTLIRGWALGFFLTIPAAVAYLVLAVPLAKALSFGRMDSTAGVTMIAVSLAVLSVAVIGQTAFLIATYASYAKKDMRSPLLSTVLQAVTCLGLVSMVLLVHGTAVLLVLGLAVSASVAVAACHLTARMWRQLSHSGARRLTPSLARFAAGAVVMAGPAWLCATEIPRWLGPPLGTRVGIAAAVLVGVGVYVGLQALWQTEELDWLTSGFTLLRGKAKRVITAMGQGDASLLQRSADRAGGGRGGTGPAAHWEERRLSRSSSRWLLWPAIIAAVGVGAVTTLGPLKAVIGLLVLLVLVTVCRWPALAGYLVIVVTPLTVGISRGAVLPLIRPSEAVDLLVAGGLAVRGMARLRTGRLPRLRLDGVEVSMLLMAVCNSVLPLLWMTLRQEQISSDDFLYALVMWKFLGLYAIVRLSVVTDHQIRRCLWLSVAAASIVAVLAILQSLKLLGISGILSNYFTYSGNGAGASGTRGSSTLGQPAATADLMVFNLAIVSGLWVRYGRHRLILGAAAALFVFGALASAEFSSAIGLVIGVVCIAIVTNSPRLLAAFIPAGLIGSGVLRSVIADRLSGFHSSAGLPASWLDRLSNLRAYFWPKLFSDWNFVLGVRPAARIPVASQIDGYVWIESGYTWLLWGGGIPLLASYVYFVLATVKRGWLAARYGTGAASVAGTAAFVAVLVTAVLMIFDPHLTYRGSADAMFALIALAAPRQARRGTAEYPQKARLHGDGGPIVRPDDENNGSDAPTTWSARFLPNGNANGSGEPARPPAGGNRRMADVGTENGPRHPGVQGQWSRFLMAHLVGIVVIAVAVTAGAALLAWSQTPEYKSQASVVVYPASSQASSTTQTADMGTEQAIASSGTVIAIASNRLHVPERTLQAGLSVSTPANTYLLHISFKDPSPRVAQQNAQALAEAYVAFRTPVQHVTPNGKRTTVQPAGAVVAAIITPAPLPMAPSSPDRVIDIVVGLILGMVLGIGFALVRDRMDDRLRGPADLETQSGAPVLAVIPAIKRGGRDPAGGLVVLHNPGSMSADAFRNLRTRVVQAAAWRSARTVLVASPAGKEEAMVSGNLAAALALTGRQVVLICTDLRWSRTQDMFGVTGHPGLTSVLDGHADLAGVIQRTDVPRLEILPAGPVSGDPAAVPQSRALPGVLDAIRHQADLLIVDAPPILAGPDTGVLAELADMVLLVADARQSTRTGVRAAARQIEQIHGVLEGCVLVNAGRRRHVLRSPAYPRLRLRPSSPGHGRVPASYD